MSGYRGKDTELDARVFAVLLEDQDGQYTLCSFRIPTPLSAVVLAARGV
jgi:hypothetical protein